MHYHWGLGVGHVHAHQSASTSGCDSNLAEDAQDIDMELLEALRDSPAQANDGGSDMGYESENPELCLEDRDFKGWDVIKMDDVDEEPASEDDFTGM